ncbi:hypothetical protein [uncultured Microscilla sp.]|uniref:hypothetical protein n=1 Tax=uncultured Microscilla sp. TaxID=432653 RepID=UPI00261100D6|nr:hypothetical protein [uncultured Microscilla sp.]
MENQKKNIKNQKLNNYQVVLTGMFETVSINIHSAKMLNNLELFHHPTVANYRNKIARYAAVIDPTNAWVSPAFFESHPIVADVDCSENVNIKQVSFEYDGLLVLSDEGVKLR